MKEIKQITPDNIHGLNDALRKQYRKNKKHEPAYITAVTVDIAVLFFVSSLLAFGMLCKMNESCANFPVLGGLWGKFHALVPLLEWAWYISIPVALLILVVPPLILHPVVYGLVLLLVQPKDILEPLPFDPVSQAKILAENHKKAFSCRRFDYGVIGAYAGIAIGILVAVGTLVVACVASDDPMSAFFSTLLPAVILGFVLFMVIGFFCVYLFMIGHDSVKDRYGWLIDSHWLQMDTAEKERREAEKRRKAAQERIKDEEYRKSLASWYVQQQKESEEYRRRLHEWATDGDDPTPDCGDGI